MVRKVFSMEAISGLGGFGIKIVDGIGLEFMVGFLELRGTGILE